MNASILALLLTLQAAPAIETAKEPGTHLYVRTIPPGAKIILDEQPGTSDGLLSVTPGKHRVVVELDGYAPERREVDVPQGRITRVEVSLKPTNDSYDGRSMAEWKRLALNDVSAETRAKAMTALAAFGNRGRADEAVAAIKSFLAQEKDQTVTQDAWYALAQLGPPAIPVLMDNLKRQDARTRQIALWAMRAYSGSTKRVLPDEVVSAIIKATTDGDPSVRGEACRSLGSGGARGTGQEHSDKIISALVNRLGDAEEIKLISWGLYRRASLRPSSVQVEACEALGSYGEKAQASVPALIEVVQRTEWSGGYNSLRYAAIEALGQIGPAAKSALPVLQSLVEARGPGNDWRVFSAIRMIQGTHGTPGSRGPQQPKAAAEKAETRK